MTTKQRMSSKNNTNCNSFIMETAEDNKNNNSKMFSRQPSPHNRPGSKQFNDSKIINNTNTTSASKNPLIQSLKGSRNSSPKNNKNIIVHKTDIFKQIGNKGLNTQTNKNTKSLLFNSIDRTIPKDNNNNKLKKDDSVIKIHHNINHNYNHNIHININTNNNNRSSNVSPLESTLSKYSSKESESSKRSDIITPKPSSSNSNTKSSFGGGAKPFLNKKNTNISFSKLAEIQNQNKDKYILDQFKKLTDEKLKKLKAIKNTRVPVSMDGLDIVVDKMINKTEHKDIEKSDINKQKIRLKLDNSVSEDMFNKFSTKDLLNSSNNFKRRTGKKISDSGSLISEESIFSKKCKNFIFNFSQK
jgi:hypothetical protein